MSRSRAKRYRVSKIFRGMKKFANKAVRQAKGFDIDGVKYKRLFNCCKICDSNAIWIGRGDEPWRIGCRRK